jgi:hypothetical protein
MRHSTFFYATGKPSRWLRRAIAIADSGLAALCQLHWEHRYRGLAPGVAVYASLSVMTPRRTAWQCLAKR